MSDDARFVFLESPYAGDVERNLAYARACMRDSLKKGELPFASHLLYTQQGILDDKISEERELGMRAGYEWAKIARAKSVFYTDLGISPGMREGMKRANLEGRVVELRTLGDGWKDLGTRDINSESAD